MDPRRRIPRTDALLAHPQVARAAQSLGGSVVKTMVRAVQDRARTGEIPPEAVEPELLAALDSRAPSSLAPVINATGVIVHTNLGRAPLSAAARQAVDDAAGYTDLEFDLVTGKRSRRGAGARTALLAACPGAEGALVVNNGAAALLLAATALTPPGPTPREAALGEAAMSEAALGEAALHHAPPHETARREPAPRQPAPHEVVLSRGEFVEIGAGFRLSDLIESAGARIREVGTTNRTHLDDYAGALSPATGSILTIHTSNFWVGGFTSKPDLSELSEVAHAHGLPLVADLGSGLLAPDPTLPDEPDAATVLAAGADLVITSGDKLLGGPQAGILLGSAATIARLSRHPMARAVRADKMALAALEATLTAGEPPVLRALHTDTEAAHARTVRFATSLAAMLAAPEVGADMEAAPDPDAGADAEAAPDPDAGADTKAAPDPDAGADAASNPEVGEAPDAAPATNAAPGPDAAPDMAPVSDAAPAPDAAAEAGASVGARADSEACTDTRFPVVPHEGRVGGGGGAGVPLPGWALALPESAAAPLRAGTPAVVGRVHEGACLIDLRCVPAEQEEALLCALAGVLPEARAEARR